MSYKWDVRQWDDAEREAYAERIRIAPEFTLPHLDIWNTALCRIHRNGWVEEYYENGEDKKRVVTDRPKSGCQDCAIVFRRHQQISVAWLYFKKDALLADTMGSGKTTSAGGLMAMMKTTGELADPDRGGNGRALIIPRSPALRQWQAELHRMMPTLQTQIAVGPRSERHRMYAQRWDALLIGPQMLVNDKEALLETQKRFSLVLTDDIDLLRHAENGAYKAIELVSNLSDRTVIMTGTPLQKQLPEMYSQLHPLGGEQLFGSVEQFKSRYMRKDRIAERSPGGLIVGWKNVTTYQNMDDFKRKIRPLYMRRTAADLEDVDMPTINPEDVLLELYPRQREAYRELQKGIVTMLKDGELKTNNQVHARAKLTYGAQICTGLAALGQDDEPMTSVKLDWVMDHIKRGGDLGNEKVVIFAQYKNTIRALQARMDGHEIGYVTIMGGIKNDDRAESIERFWKDPNCRILIGTQAIEQSLNLQVARHLINLDMIMNPARMEQLAGRIRRDGSAFKHVFVHNLLTVDTQEERYLPLLEREAALAGYVWDEDSELFNQLSPTMMLRLITG